MTHSFATVILAGGKGTRMGTTDRHKVCFEVCGKPVILRALENYNLCGSKINIIVVGAKAENVMSTVSHHFNGVIFAHQPEALGTGDAAMKAVEILERIKYNGDVLITAGDKLIETNVIYALMNVHRKNSADATLAVIKRVEGSSEGIIITNSKGEVVGILEESEKQRVIAIHEMYKTIITKKHIPIDELNTLLKEKVSQRVINSLSEYLKGKGIEHTITMDNMVSFFTHDEINGILRVCDTPLRAEEVSYKFQYRNQSTYVFKSHVLYETLPAIQKLRNTQEKYLTDIFHVLSQTNKKYKIVSYAIENQIDLMSFNNPQELLAIEEAYRMKEKILINESNVRIKFSTPIKWLNAIRDMNSELKHQLTKIYGDEIPVGNYEKTLKLFADRFSPEAPILVVRAPGRINLMGRHIDHQGGDVNIMAINREIIFIVSQRGDDTVVLTNASPEFFPEKRFKISELIANLDWEDWEQVVDGKRLQRLLQEGRGDWTNYIAAAILRLQEQFRDRRLRGFNVIVGGNIPMGAGLSSSSAVVVATAEAVAAINSLPVSAKQLVSLCGEGEWYVGTRGGTADHAAIKLAKKGYVTRVGFFPFTIGESAHFPDSHKLIVCNSGIHAGKSEHACDMFNTKVTTCHLGKIFFKMMAPEFAPKIEHLRDINPENLGIDFVLFIELLSRLPQKITQKDVISAFSAMNIEDREKLKKLFQTHTPPKNGYKLRDVVIYELSEIQRAKKCLSLLKQNKMSELGQLMKISHDGDRIAYYCNKGIWSRKRRFDSAKALISMKGKSFDSFMNLSGSYECSLPQIDRIVDIACGLEGVEGAQLAGAGLGGCVMVLVKNQYADNVVEFLKNNNIDAEIFIPISGACCLQIE